MKTTLTINEIIDEWLLEADVVDISAYYYRRKLHLWFRYLSSNGIDPRGATRRDAIGYKRKLEADGYTELTINGYVTVVKLFYKFLERKGYCDNIAVGIRSSSRYKGHRKGRLFADEAKRMIDSIDYRTEIGKRDRMMIALMLFYGLRTCEVERIDVDDFIDRNGRYLMRLQRKGRREKNEMIAVSGNILDMWEDYTSCRSFQSGDPLFVSHSRHNNGKRLCRKTISSIVKDRLRAIGIDRKEITAHSLRHTCASMLIDDDVPIADVQDVLGHSDIATTRIYTEDAQREKIIRNNPSLLLENSLLKREKESISHR